METVAIVKIAQGNRIPLGKAVCGELGVVKGDYVVISRSDSGHIFLSKPSIPMEGIPLTDSSAEV